MSKKRQVIKQKILWWMAFLGIFRFIAGYLNILRKAHKGGAADLTKIFWWRQKAFSKKVIRRQAWQQSDGTLLPQTAQEDHFIYLSLRSLALYTSLKNLPEKNCLSAKSSVWKGASSVSISPGLFLPPPLYLSMPPPINPSLSLRLPCANLYSLSHAKHLSWPHWMPLQSNLHLSGCKAF